MQRKEKPLTNQDRLEYWQMCRTIIDMRRHLITKEEARKRFALWSDLPTDIANQLFEVMRKQTILQLMKASPKWLPKYPKFKTIDQEFRADKGKPRPHTRKRQAGSP